jgi:hypothetical protein
MSGTAAQQQNDAHADAGGSKDCEPGRHRARLYQ